MSYWTISQLSNDTDLIAREAACYAQESGGAEDATTWALKHALQLASQPGWDIAYRSALESEVPNPGRDEAVITDSNILAAVQHVLELET